MEKLKEARLKAGHSQNEASVYIGVGLSTLLKAENGETPKNKHIKAALARYINKFTKES